MSRQTALLSSPAASPTALRHCQSNTVCCSKDVSSPRCLPVSLSPSLSVSLSLSLSSWMGCLVGDLRRARTRRPALMGADPAARVPTVLLASSAW
jgi:hypothetical protein